MEDQQIIHSAYDAVHRSGKSSISNVVFRKMAPQDTLFLETTTKIQKEDMQ